MIERGHTMNATEKKKKFIRFEISEIYIYFLCKNFLKEVFHLFKTEDVLLTFDE